MKRILVFVAWILGIVMPSHAFAGTPYVINWLNTSENPGCVTAQIVEGAAFFNANGTPLPTYSMPGAYTYHPNGFESNLAKASFDSVLLRMGANNIEFSVGNSSGNDWCAKISNVVTLEAPTLGIEKLLFNFRREGSAFSGSTQLDLKLEEINPQLAQNIAILETELAAERKWLVANADKIRDLDGRLDALQQLETELGDLLTRPLDEISVEDLEEMLARYSSVIDEATREALKQVLTDLKKSIDDLQKELASLMATFGAQADAVTDFLTGDARQNGFNPDDPSNYGLGPNDVPWVEIPDISNVPGAFDPQNDPYAAYANAVIASLDENVSGGKVIGRADFVAEVRAWRSNQKALEQAILTRMSVSQAETSAFLNAQIKVTGYLQKYMDGSGWFHDSPIPQDVRADVDGPLKNLYGVLAEDLKEALLLWDAKNNPPEANLFFDTLRAFSAGMQAGDELVEEYRNTMRSIVHGASRIGIGFVPFVGPALDLCEAVSGHEWCLPSGRKLTTGERVFSGIGFGIGKLVKVWKGVSTAAISSEGKLAAAAIYTMAPEVLEKVAKARIQKWKTLTRGSILPDTVEALVNDWESKVILALIEKKNHKVLAMGKGVEDVLGIKVVQGKAGKAADALTVSPNGGLIITEAKFPRAALNERPAGVDCYGALEQLTNSMEHAVVKGVAQDVEVVQIVFPKGAVLSVHTIKEEGVVLETFTYTIKNGYLLENGQRIPMPGKPNFFVTVLELEQP